ncbi:MAG: LD-carboxypeptidase [Gemmatimonadaceae bacterium]
MRHYPARLASGARVALIAPSGPLGGPEELARAEANVRSFGWEPVAGEHALARREYLAGDDADRLRDLNWALAADPVDGIWCLRGGYGTMRLLDGVDYAAIRRRPKPLIGFSDITALHAAIAVRADVVTFHGPTARSPLSAFARASLGQAVVTRTDPCGDAPAARTLISGVARGCLAGGNLALLSSLAGTPYAPRFDGTIVVIEDVQEPVYRIDRMLTQLRLAGLLRGCRGLMFGAFTALPAPETHGAGVSLNRVLDDFAAVIGVPSIAGAPIGHIDDQWTVPLGAHAELDAGARRVTVTQAVAENRA